MALRACEHKVCATCAAALHALALYACSVAVWNVALSRLWLTGAFGPSNPAWGAARGCGDARARATATLDWSCRLPAAPGAPLVTRLHGFDSVERCSIRSRLRTPPPLRLESETSPQVHAGVAGLRAGARGRARRRGLCDCALQIMPFVLMCPCATRNFDPVGRPCATRNFDPLGRPCATPIFAPRWPEWLPAMAPASFQPLILTCSVR